MRDKLQNHKELPNSKVYRGSNSLDLQMEEYLNHIQSRQNISTNNLLNNLNNFEANSEKDVNMLELINQIAEITKNSVDLLQKVTSKKAHSLTENYK